MNILLLPSWYPTEQNPLSGIFFREQAQALCRAGLKVYVLALNIYSLREIRKYIKTNHKNHFFNDDGVKTCVINYLNIFPRLRAPLWIYSSFLLKMFYKRLQKRYNIQFDIVHIHSALQAGFIYYFSGLKTKYVLTEHSTAYSMDWLNNSEKKYLFRIFSNSAYLIAVGKGLKVEMQKYTNRPIEVIYNIVNLDNYSTNAEAKNKFRFVSLGLNLQKKGFDILIKAYGKTSIWKSCELYIAGLEKEEIQVLQDLVRKIGLENVRLFGKLSREETASYMYNCDCFVLPSRVETFGVVAAEAMYYGKPVIASKTGGPDTFITPETGLIVSVGSVDETAKAMETVYRNISDYDADYIKNYALRNFSSENIAKKLIAIYDRI
jgi:glycosyltransferase involved in cell wall biosynthesis